MWRRVLSWWAERKHRRKTEALIRGLRSRDWDRRTVACQMLGDMGDVAAVEPLITALSDDHYKVSLAAVEALLMIPDRRAVMPLIDYLKTRQGSSGSAEKQQIVAICALKKIADPQAVIPLVEFLGIDNEDHASFEARGYAVVALGEFGDERAVEALVAALSEPFISFDCPGRALVKIGKAAVQPLLAALGHDYERVREKAAAALGEIGDSRALKALTFKLGDPFIRVRAAAAKSLDQLAWNPGNPDDEALHAVAACDWGRVDQLGVASVMALLHVFEYDRSQAGVIGDCDLRTSIATSLGHIGDKRAVDALVKCLYEDPILQYSTSTRGSGWVKLMYVAATAAEALGKIGDARATEALLTRAQSDEEIAQTVIDALVSVLQADAQSVPPATLHTLASTSDLTQHEYSDPVGREKMVIVISDRHEVKVDCSSVRALAKRELDLRG